MSGSTGSFGDMFSDPTTMGLLGLAQGFGQAALPTPYKGGTPLGAMIGMAAGGMGQGVRQAQQYAAGQQQLQAAQISNERMRAYLDAIKGQGGAAFGVPSATSGDPNQPVVTYKDAVRNMYLHSLDPQGGAATRAWQSLAESLVPKGGGFVGTEGGGVVPVAGANPAAGSRTGAVEGTKAAIDVNKAWDMLAPEARKALQAAGIDVSKAWQMPGSYAPGNTVGSPAQLQNPNAPPPPDPFPGIARQIQGFENNTGNPAATNPQSSAVGNGQFLDGTWPDVVRATRPDLMQGRTPQQILALRSDPDLSSAMTESYARQNGAALVNAGLPPTPANVYLAHRLGPGGAIAALKANPNMPVGLAVPNGSAVVAANPDLRGRTVGDLVGMAQQRMTPPLPLPPQPPAAGGTAAPIQTPPMAKPAVVPASPQATEAESEGKRLATLPQEINGQAKESQNALNRIALAQTAMANAAKGNLSAGYFSPELARAAAAAKSLGISVPGVDPKAVGNAQVANEALVQISGEILKRLFPQRITNMDIKLYGDALPHFGMDPKALDTLLDQAKQAAQYDVAKGQNMLAYQKQNKTLDGWEPQFYQSNGYGPQFFQAMEAAQGKGTPAPDAGGPPANLLEDGKATPFKNGQVWTLQNGKPTRLR